MEDILTVSRVAFYVLLVVAAFLIARLIFATNRARGAAGRLRESTKKLREETEKLKNETKVLEELKSSLMVLRRFSEAQARVAALPGKLLSRKERSRILNERAKSNSSCNYSIWCNLPKGHEGHHRFICEVCRYDQVEYDRTEETYLGPVDIYKCGWCGKESRVPQ